jgi:hypothetical protein
VPQVATLALARPTFDVPYAEAVAADAFASLDRLGLNLVGPRHLLMDAAAVEAALGEVAGAGPLDLILLLQVTFTDAGAAVLAAGRADPAPVALWAFPEPRTGGRLRLNSLCGINLAAHALGLAGRRATPPPARRRPGRRGPAAVDTRRPQRIRRCRRALPRRSQESPTWQRPRPRWPRFAVAGWAGSASIRRLSHLRLRPRPAATPVRGRGRPGRPNRPLRPRPGGRAAETERLRERASRELDGLDSVDAAATDRSLGLYAALRDVARERNLAGLAVRCWPEPFTELGCAACRPMGMLTEEGVPAACEADVPAR